MPDDQASQPVAKKPWGWREIATFIVSMTAIIGFFVLVLEGKVPNEDMHIAIGALIGWVGASYQFYTGSSQGSVVKTDLIEKKN